MQVEALVSGCSTHPPDPFVIYKMPLAPPPPNPYFYRFFLGSGETLTESEAFQL